MEHRVREKGGAQGKRRGGAQGEGGGWSTG